MVTFSCRCGSNFTFPDDMAGKQVQCPRCGLLNDVPTQDELKLMSPDGTYRMDEVAPARPDAFEEMRVIYGGKDEQTGEILDLREPLGQGVVHEDDGGIPAIPKYDPESGELIRPLEIQQKAGEPTNPSEIPMARSVLTYASGDLSQRQSLLFPARELFRAANLASLAFVLGAHLLLLGMLALLTVMAPVTYAVTVPLGTIAMLMGLLAHYANTIEDIGPDQRGEVPRFLRYFNFGEDVWRPFWRVMLALFYCYGLAWVVYSSNSLRPNIQAMASLSLMAAGAFFFPAALLTSTTSGALPNLRPDRVIGVIGVIGPRYWFLAILWLVTGLLYYLGMWGTILYCAYPSGLLKTFNVLYFIPANILANPLVSYPALIVAVYLMHIFCWDLGILYEANHPRFPWVLQRHVRTEPRPERLGRAGLRRAIRKQGADQGGAS